VDWVKDFYSRTGTWWGRAESQGTERDQRRVALLHEHAGAGPLRVLELGAGYGTTAAATAAAGHDVTAVEISDRVEFAAAGTFTLVHDDFYRVRLAGRFDVVTYWNGFGVGSDDDQRVLLRRIAGEWLRPGGVALIDIFNPFVWARWNGEEEHRLPRPEEGYEYELFERTTFDPVTCTAYDTWWEAGHPDDRITQALRCYSPADLKLLLDGTGLRLAGLVGGDAGLLQDSHEYQAVLRHDGSAGR
jgi:SAM-dependent methyltransferase